MSYSNETDEKLLQWVLRQQDKGTPVTRDAIQAQARLLVRDECPEFKASSGWVEKFLSRHNLTIATKMSSQNPSGKCGNIIIGCFTIECCNIKTKVITMAT